MKCKASHQPLAIHSVTVGNSGDTATFNQVSKLSLLNSVEVTESHSKFLFTAGDCVLCDMTASDITFK